MIETLRVQNQPLPTTPELIGEISSLSKQIAAIYSLRDESPNRFLPITQYNEIRRLHVIKDQITIDLLLANLQAPDDRIEIVISKYPNEEIHPFSMNKISIYAPSTENPEEEYLIKTELFDLRRSGVAQNSKEAETLLGGAFISDETGFNFAFRTASELIAIRKATKEIMDGNTAELPYSVEELHDLSAKLIVERLVPLRLNGKLPADSILSFFMYEDTKGNILAENTNLVLRGKVYDFPTSGQRLLPTVTDFGGYDKIVTLID